MLLLLRANTMSVCVLFVLVMLVVVLVFQAVLYN